MKTYRVSFEVNTKNNFMFLAHLNLTAIDNEHLNEQINELKSLHEVLNITQLGIIS